MTQLNWFYMNFWIDMRLNLIQHKLRKCALNINVNISLGTDIEDLILNLLKELEVTFKQCKVAQNKWKADLHQ